MTIGDPPVILGKIPNNENITLRDYFAAQAMQVWNYDHYRTPEIAEYAYELADAMIEERNKKEKNHD